MSICENCRTSYICTEANEDKEACWFFSPTEKYRIEQSKEYAIGYEQGVADRTKELQKQFDMLYADKLEQVRTDERTKLLAQAECKNAECWNCAMSDGDMNCMLKEQSNE